jgi:vacuolar-type H+-ATPase subunit I/STV1
MLSAIMTEINPMGDPKGFGFFEKIVDKLPINKVKTQHVIIFLGYLVLGFFILAYKWCTGDPPSSYMKDVYFWWIILTVTLFAIRIEFKKR